MYRIYLKYQINYEDYEEKCAYNSHRIKVSNIQNPYLQSAFIYFASEARQQAGIGEIATSN